MNKGHQKHAKLAKPDLGYFGRNELSILGTPCGDIKTIANAISRELSSQYNVAYVDADHKSADDESNLMGNPLAEGFSLVYTDKIDFTRVDAISAPESFESRQWFNAQDLILVNGNHFEANSQIIVIDHRKPLEKKLAKLTNVVAVIAETDDIIPDYLLKKMPEINNLPRFSKGDHEGLINFVDQFLVSRMPELNGLVLSGGRSERMQRDKASLEYHGQSQKLHMYGLLRSIVSDVFYSVRADQASDRSNEILDKFTGLGPYGAIISAMMDNPNRAWLVTAVDQPFLNEQTLRRLIDARNPSKLATAFYNPETDFPEPLVTIWEPRAYPVMLNYLSQGYSCPRKVLINSDIELIKLEDATALDNVNTPEEYLAARKRLGLNN